MRTSTLTLLALLIAACDGDVKGSADGVDTAALSDPQIDADGDGFPQESDCNDADPAVRPGAVEICDGIDNDCDLEVDEDVTVTYYADSDGDGYGDPGMASDSCDRPEGYVPNDSDCDDTSAEAYPSGVEVCDELDNDCDGTVDEDLTVTVYADTDADGYGNPDTATEACSAGPGFVLDGTDCDDSTDTMNPGEIEVCDERDNDCDTLVDEDTTTIFYADTDSDGHGDIGTTIEACTLPAGYAIAGDDCDDTDPNQMPGAVEYCNTEDDDCDGIIDEPDAADALTWYADTDTDTFGDLAAPTLACTQPTGFVDNSGDCDDTDPTQSPTSPERCNGEDDDCDTLTDEADAIDQPTWYQDGDSDSYGNASVTAVACNADPGWVADNTDCDDAAPAVHPMADEYCNEIDDDCDTVVDEPDAVDASALALDMDGDGFGEAGSTRIACDGVPNDLDCNDVDPSEPMVVDGIAGSSAGDGSSASPFDTIQAGIDAANECVVVYPGTYVETIDFGGADLIVQSTDGSASTTINGAGGASAVASFTSGETAAATLKGFTLTGGAGQSTVSTRSWACTSVTTCTETTTTYCGGGLYIDGSDPTFEDVIVEDNTLPESSTSTTGDDTYYVYSFGGGVCALDSNATFIDSVVQGNFADQGGGYYVDELSAISLEQSEILDNTATDGAGVEVDTGSFSAVNVLWAYNTATTTGGAVYVADGNFEATNITAAFDAATNGGELAFTGTGSGTVMNSILGYAAAGQGVYLSGTGTFTGTYNNVYGNADGQYSGITDPTGLDGNQSVNPRFFNPATYNFALLATSPLVDAGNPDAAYNDEDGTANDMGAYGGPGGTW